MAGSTRQPIASVLFAMTVLILSTSWAAAQGIASESAASVGSCEMGEAYSDLDANEIRARLYNSGGLFWNGGDPIYEAPAGSGRNPVFAAGLWIGGLIDGDFAMAASTYGPWEFWPGPIDEHGSPPANCSAFDRIYKVSKEDIVAYDETGAATADLADWPADLGAPVRDGDGDPHNYSLTGGDRPEMPGDQVHWWVMNDLGNVHEWSGANPIGLEVQVTAWASQSDDFAFGFTTFYNFRLIKKGPGRLDSTSVGFFMDADVGYPNDDYAGTDTTLNMLYAWNADNSDEGELGYGPSPPAVGLILPNSLSRSVFFTNNSPEQGDPEGGRQAFGMMRGYWADGSPVTYGGTGHGGLESKTDFMFPGEPREFWSEENIDDKGGHSEPGDRRLLGSLKPFTMAQGDVLDLPVAIIFARGADRLHSVELLKYRAKKVLGIDADGPQPPTRSPQLKAPADGVSGQPVNPRLHWGSMEDANAYLVQASSDSVFHPFLKVSDPDTQLAVFLSPNTTYYWRVRGSNYGGYGPWSSIHTFRTGDNNLRPPGILEVSAGPAFLQVVGIGDDDACGPAAGSREGCDEFGGNNVYDSFNGQGNWVMWHQGEGPEERLPEFAPNDFEIRVTDGGSYAYHDRTTGAAIWVPWEVWDIGGTGPFGVNDPADDKQLIGAVFSDNGGECRFDFGEILQDWYGFGWPVTDRLGAFQPVEGHSYADWEEVIRPIIDNDPGSCPRSPDTEPGKRLIDLERGPVLQNLVFTMDPQDPAFRDEMIPVGNVIRFITTGDASRRPIHSAPADGAVVEAPGVELWWQSPFGVVAGLQIAADAAFTQILVEEHGLRADHYVFETTENQRYYWRVRSERQATPISDWTAPWTFTTGVGVSTEGMGQGIPTVFALHPNYPNPFNPSTTIRYDVPEASRVRLTVFDVLGRLVEELGTWNPSAGSEQALAPGTHSVTWDASGRPSGIYFVRMEAGNFTKTRRMILVK